MRVGSSDFGVVPNEGGAFCTSDRDHLLACSYLYIDLWDPSRLKLRREEAKVQSTLWLIRRIQLASWGLREPRTNGVKLGLVREASSAVETTPMQNQRNAQCFRLPHPLPDCASLALSRDWSSEKDCLEGSQSPDMGESDVQLETRIQLGGLTGLH